MACLSFNFVQINVNLLEKQLSTVYFKDVRFPWVTLYKDCTYKKYSYEGSYYVKVYFGYTTHCLSRG